MHKCVKILLFLHFIYIQSITAQNPILKTPVSIKISNTSVNNILDILSAKTAYYFSYDVQILNSDNKITLDEKNVQLKDLLEKVFSEKLNFVIIKKHIIISKFNVDSSRLIINNSDSIIQIKGKITDAKTKKPIPYASVGILNTTLGTVSNLNGEFTFKLPFFYVDSTVYFVSLGYENFETSVRNFVKNNPIIQLQQVYVSIEEVIIRNPDPEQILLKTIFNIQENYAQSPNLLTVFYRESVQKNKSLYSYSEVLATIYKTPYRTTLNSDQIKVLKSRKIVNTGINDTLNFKLQDGLYSGLNIDLIKNKIDFLDENKMQNYNYQLTDIVSYNNSTAYVVSFKQKKYIKSPLFFGRLYIDNKNFALIAAEFEYNLSSGNRKVNFVARKSRKFNVIPLAVKYFISYKKVHGKYNINHIRGDLDFKVRKKRSLFSSKYHTSFETVLLNSEETNIKRFRKNETLKRNRVFIDTNYEYDAEFWGSNNFISPEKSITEALKEIHTKINASE